MSERIKYLGVGSRMIFVDLLGWIVGGTIQDAGEGGKVHIYLYLLVVTK